LVTQKGSLELEQRGSSKLTSQERRRCDWAGTDPLYVSYHDEEWGVPVHDDVTLFEFLTLEGAQAGLSWLTILRKREGYRHAFRGFDVQRVARFNTRTVNALLQESQIVRNRAKIEATIKNARAFIAVQEQFGSFADYQWRFVDGRPIQHIYKRIDQIPPRSELSDSFSKDLKQRGFAFVGSTIVYSHMQATGMVNDHLVSCARHDQVAKLAKRILRKRPSTQRP
jgi:DNA-3-methyladenine glycosylase I